MKILVAPDKFKGSLTASEIGKAVQEGIHRFDARIEVISFPLADGGDGTAAVLTQHAGGAMQTCPVADPLFRTVEASFGLSADRGTAFLEMAEASGLRLLKPEERNPLRTSSFGTGQLIARAVALGARKIILGIGGSATNDGGIGMAAALGYRFLDAKGEELLPVGENLIHIARIDDSRANSKIKTLSVRVACDVDNPLTGSQGAAYVYGPQKGASPEQVAALDRGLAHLAEVMKSHLGKDFAQVPGAGAAGGMGAGVMAFLGAKLVSGTQLVLEQTGFAGQLADVDMVITGEGKIDRQTLHGKLIKGVTDEAKKRAIPVVAICGTLEAGPEEIEALGLSFAASVIRRPCTLDEAMRDGRENVAQLAYNLIRLFAAGRR